MAVHRCVLAAGEVQRSGRAFLAPIPPQLAREMKFEDLGVQCC